MHCSRICQIEMYEKGNVDSVAYICRVPQNIINNTDNFFYSFVRFGKMVASLACLLIYFRPLAASRLYAQLHNAKCLCVMVGLLVGSTKHLWPRAPLKQSFSTCVSRHTSVSW